MVKVNGVAGQVRPRIVVVGRSNAAKPSGSLAALVTDLRHAGYPVSRFEPGHTRTRQWLEDRSTKLVDAWRGRGPRWVPPNKLVKLLILLAHPRRWSYFLPLAIGRRRALLIDLRRFLRLQGGPVFLVAHSAGGIVSSLVESDDTVAGVICFGYPFRQPDRAEERYRTAHLPGVTKPFLIIQGNRDVYGTAAEARRYALSASTVVVGVDSGHDYDGLDRATYQRCRELLTEFVLKGSSR